MSSTIHGCHLVITRPDSASLLPIGDD